MVFHELSVCKGHMSVSSCLSCVSETIRHAPRTYVHVLVSTIIFVSTSLSQFDICEYVFLGKISLRPHCACVAYGIVLTLTPLTYWPIHRYSTTPIAERCNRSNRQQKLQQRLQYNPIIQWRAGILYLQKNNNISMDTAWTIKYCAMNYKPNSQLSWIKMKCHSHHTKRGI